MAAKNKKQRQPPTQKTTKKHKERQTDTEQHTDELGISIVGPKGPVEIPPELLEHLKRQGVEHPENLNLVISGRRLKEIRSEVSFSTIYPPPEVLKDYKAIDTRLIDFIIKHVDIEQEHRHKLDNDSVEISKDELAYKKRGQIIAAILVPIIIILVGIYSYLMADKDNQVVVLKIFLGFVFGIAVLFATGRIMSGLENIFGNKD